MRPATSRALRRQRSVSLRTPVAIKLPDSSYFLDHVEIEVGDQHFILIAAGLHYDLAARVAEVTLAVKLADVPRLFPPHAIDGSDEVSVSGGVRGLFQFPQIFGEAGDRGRRIEHNLRAVQAQHARAFGKMPIVANVDSNAGKFRFEHGISKVAGREIEFLPEAGMHVRDVMLAILAKIGAIRIDNGGRIEIEARHLLFIYRNDNDHAMFGRDLLH